MQSAEAAGVAFKGDWRVALRDLRALLQKTRTYLELEASSELDGMTYSSNASSMATNPAADSATSNCSPRSQDTYETDSTQTTTTTTNGLGALEEQENDSRQDTHEELRDSIEDGWSQVPDDIEAANAAEEESVVI